MEEKKEKFLKIAYDCFTIAAGLQSISENREEDDLESHDEKWLNQYMLGKIAEKRKGQPEIYMNHYLKVH